jgi:hypothetical protein
MTLDKGTIGYQLKRVYKGGNKMPVKITDVGGGYRVSTPGGVKAKKTTKRKAKKQKRLLNAIEHGWRPTRRR